MASVLVIDEDKDTCNLIERVLTRQGHSVTTFTRGNGAFEWLKQNAPDLVMVSAGKRGEKVREIVRLLGSAGIDGSAIVLSATPGSLRAVRKAFAGKVRDILVKPADLEDLERVVGTIL